MKKIVFFSLFILTADINLAAAQIKSGEVPSFLLSYKTLYRKDPHAATLKWFEDSRYGMFIHWGPSAAYQKGEWVMYNQKLPIRPYMEKALTFTGEKFNADEIVQLAVKAQMKYITFVVRHHDGFSLYDTKAGTFSSIHAKSKRDYLKELANACRKEKVGLFIYYSIGIDWTHPFYLTREFYSAARPNYPKVDTAIRFRGREDFVHYWNYVKTQIYELATEYGDVAGFWFDTIGGCYENPDLFDMQNIYDMIRRLQPQALITFKTGFNGNEDFLSCEHEIKPLTSLMKTVQGNGASSAAAMAWEKNKSKPAELCTTMQNGGWGYSESASHKSAKEVLALLDVTASNNANLLMNIGPLPDGSLHPDDVKALVEAGDNIRRKGLPKPDKINFMKLREVKKANGGRDFETAK